MRTFYFQDYSNNNKTMPKYLSKFKVTTQWNNMIPAYVNWTILNGSRTYSYDLEMLAYYLEIQFDSLINYISLLLMLH